MKSLKTKAKASKKNQVITVFGVTLKELDEWKIIDSTIESLSEELADNTVCLKACKSDYRDEDCFAYLKVCINGKTYGHSIGTFDRRAHANPNDKFDPHTLVKYQMTKDGKTITRLWAEKIEDDDEEDED